MVKVHRSLLTVRHFHTFIENDGHFHRALRLDLLTVCQNGDIEETGKADLSGYSSNILVAIPVGIFLRFHLDQRIGALGSDLIIDPLQMFTVLFAGELPHRQLCVLGDFRGILITHGHFVVLATIAQGIGFHLLREDASLIVSMFFLSADQRPGAVAHIAVGVVLHFLTDQGAGFVIAGLCMDMALGEGAGQRIRIFHQDFFRHKAAFVMVMLQDNHLGADQPLLLVALFIQIGFVAVFLIVRVKNDHFFIADQFQGGSGTVLTFLRQSGLRCCCFGIPFTVFRQSALRRCCFGIALTVFRQSTLRCLRLRRLGLHNAVAIFGVLVFLDLGESTHQGTLCVITFPAVGMYQIVRLTADQDTLCIKAVRFMYMNTQRIVAAVQDFNRFREYLFIAAFGMDMFRQSAFIPLHGDGGQDQSIGRAENHHAGHGADDFTPIAPPLELLQVFLCGKTKFLFHCRTSFISETAKFFKRPYPKYNFTNNLFFCHATHLRVSGVHGCGPVVAHYEDLSVRNLVG